MALRYRWLRVATVNTRIGHAVTNGALKRLLWVYRPHALLLQEVTSLEALKKLLGDGWYLVPMVEHSHQAQTYTAVLKSRFRVLWSGVEDITHGDKHVRLRPVIAADDLKTGRTCVFSSVHVQPLGRGLAKASEGARSRQQKQISEYVDAAAGRTEEVVVIDGGDYNQDLDQKYVDDVASASANVMYRHAGMVALHKVARHGRGGRIRFDDIFYRPASWIIPWRRKEVDYTKKFQGLDHPFIVATFLVKPATDSSGGAK